ncbi:MAG: DoxX family protein [Sphingobacteriaceae bacterium]|nr:DoxX family protein [Sphingobacteriaceae bacterium]
MTISKKRISLYIMSAVYLLAGLNHFINPHWYSKITPTWLCCHKELIILSGICEILLSISLLFPKTRRFGAFGIIALLVAVFPANIQMFVNYLNSEHPQTWVTAIRLPLQLFLIWWAFLFTKPLR